MREPSKETLQILLIIIFGLIAVALLFAFHDLDIVLAIILSFAIVLSGYLARRTL